MGSLPRMLPDFQVAGCSVFRRLHANTPVDHPRAAVASRPFSARQSATLRQWIAEALGAGKDDFGAQDSRMGCDSHHFSKPSWGPGAAKNGVAWYQFLDFSVRLHIYIIFI